MKPDDPMGLMALGASVARLVRLREDSVEKGKERPARWMICVEQLEEAFSVVAEKYELLRDRYALLKRSNSHLADELSWLRDQCDDLATGQPTGPPREVGGPGDQGKPRRRYSDRWLK